MSNQHTRGPWTLTHKRGSNFAVQEWEIRGMFADRPNISPIFNRNISAIEGTTFCASPEDARLIAAAPELLAALTRLIGTPKYWDDLHHEAGCGCVIHQARAAAAKATGEI